MKFAQLKVSQANDCCRPRLREGSNGASILQRKSFELGVPAGRGCRGLDGRITADATLAAKKRPLRSLQGTLKRTEAAIEKMVIKMWIRWTAEGETARTER